MEFYLFAFWIVLMISVFVKVALAYYKLQEELKEFETNDV